MLNICIIIDVPDRGSPETITMSSEFDMGKDYPRSQEGETDVGYRVK